MRKGCIRFVVAVILAIPKINSWAQLPELAPADLSQLKPADFADDELDMPYFLAHLSKVANAVVPEGENRGFIAIGVWRSSDTNRPYNARILENYLSLAYFYCTKRPWNPYYGDTALRKRLEAVFEYWCNSQSDDGRFSEYGPRQWNLAATAFATKFMGATLAILKDGPAIDPDLLKRVIQADRKAILAVLTRDDLYDHGREFTNQYCNVWSGGLAYLRLYPDPEIEGLLRKRIKETVTNFQSPAGYFYERNGPDWSYNLGTQPTNLETARYFTEERTLLDIFTAEERLFYEWLAYNAVMEPDGSVFVLNRAVETRGRVPLIGREPAELFSRDALPAEQVELARPFCTSREELEARRVEARARLEKEWPNVSGLRGFTPYDFLGRHLPRWLPTNEQRRQATAKLPYLARQRFIHQRTDNRFPISYTFIRRPSYYAAFNSGRVVSDSQRYGLGLLWNTVMGAVLQSQTGSIDAAWGTLPKDAKKPIEAESFQPVFTINGRAVTPKSGAVDLPNGTLAIEYMLGKTGKKQVRFEESGIKVAIQLAGDFTENIPLLVGQKDAVLLKPGRAELGRLVVTFDATSKPRLQDVEERRPFRQSPFGSKSVRVLHLDSRDALAYVLKFQD